MRAASEPRSFYQLLVHPTYVGRSTAAWLLSTRHNSRWVNINKSQTFLGAHYSEVLAAVLSVRSQPEGVVAIIIDWHEQ